MRKVLILLLLLAGCGQYEPNDRYTVNSLFISIKNNLLEQNVFSQNKFNFITTDINNRITENILFRDPYRPTTIQFGDLEQNILGLTECEYQSNGSSSCKITLSNLINPDSAQDQATKIARENILSGVMRHEIGHAFGLGHVTDNDNHVMYPYFKNIQLNEANIQKYIIDLDNFRKNGPASGLPSVGIN